MVFGKLFSSAGKSKSKRTKASGTDDSELKQAATLLLYKMVCSDGVADKMELIHLKEILRKEFKLDQGELDQLTEFATQTDFTAISISDLAEEIRNHCGNAKRIKILEYLWILAFVDDRIDPKESEFVTQVAQLLYLNDAEMARAQENAETVLGIGF